VKFLPQKLLYIYESIFKGGNKMLKKSEITQITDDKLQSTKILFEVKEEADGNSTLVINNRHPFFEALYQRTNMLKNTNLYEEDMEFISQTFKEIQSLIDVLFMAYAKAESVVYNPNELFSDLRKDWGNKTDIYVNQLIKK
jgi:hypothetical protein